MTKLQGRVLTAREIGCSTKFRRVVRGVDSFKYRRCKCMIAVKRLAQQLYCNRCLSNFSLSDGYIRKGYYYCPYCLQFGRLTSQMFIYIDDHPVDFATANCGYLVWHGKLSHYQQVISNQLVASNYKKELLLAVTGAGKTEMIYQVLDQYLQNGKQVCYVSPRVDVVKEIGQRFKKVFPTLTIPILYNDSPEEYEVTPFLVMTTHQLVKFYHCFDLIIIDEADAFPYINSTFLQRQVVKALKEDGRIINLTATMHDKLIQDSEQIYILPIRYHLQPLMIPKYQFIFNSYKYLLKEKLPYCIKRAIMKLERQVLIFFPNIKQMKQWCKILQDYYPDKVIDAVSSMSCDRSIIVEKMRQKEIDILCTTIILERGVTFENIDVWIFDAHHISFTTSAIIQIAGRVGRSAQFPKGNVILFASGYTKDMKRAILEIKKLNDLAGKMLHEMPTM